MCLEERGSLKGGNSWDVVLGLSANDSRRIHPVFPSFKGRDGRMPRAQF